MNLYSTNLQSPNVGLEEAVFRGLPPDNGLYMPTEFRALAPEFWENIENLSLQEIAFEIAHALIGEDIPTNDLKNLINQAIDFPAPLVEIQKNIYCLELFHGPTMAFKDVGARFMSRCLA